MEITLNIPKNTWSKPTKVRQDVVQLICDIFLRGGSWHSLYHAIIDNRYGLPYKDFADNYDYRGQKWFVEFNECEMRMAFKALQKAGYHFEASSNRNSSYLWYKLTPKDYASYSYNFIVYDFCEQWD